MGQRGTVLDISDLHSGYEMIKTTKDTNVHVDKDELASLLGANGADKSALLESVIGVVHIERGSIEHRGEELVGRGSHEITPMGISIIPERHKIFVDAMMVESLAVGSYTRATDKALDQEILDQVFEFFPRLAERKTQVGGTLSGGEQQVLVIRRAMMSDPKLLLLDEPFMGPASLMVEQVFHIMERLERTGITILLVEQNARMAIKVSDRSYILNMGKIVGELDASDEASQDALLEVYLGKSGKQRGEQVS